MTPRAALTDLKASAPAEAVAAIERASDAYDAGDTDTAAITLFAASRAGLTTWHQRAAELADAIELHADADGLAMHAESAGDAQGELQ